MSDYRTIQIDRDFYCIEQDFVRCFLLVGEKEALLVDTGFGGSDLQGYIKGITDLPVRVIFTHADGDHVGCAGLFENRFMHPCEYDYYYNNNKNTVPVTPVWEGEIIDIGSYRFEVILIPGHTPGSIALLEREKRFLIGGDSIQTGRIFMFGHGRNFSAFRDSMKKMEQRSIEFDRIYASHHEMCVSPDTIRRLYIGAVKVMQGLVCAEAEKELSKRFNRDIKCYETDGVAFLAE